MDSTLQVNVSTEEIPSPITEKISSTITVINEDLIGCRMSADRATPKYSLSPDGNYLVSVSKEQYDPVSGRYSKDGVSYSGLKILQVWKVTDNKKVPKSFHRLISTSSSKSNIGYAWSTDNILYYRGLNYHEGRPDITGYDPNKDIEFTLTHDNDPNHERYRNVLATIEGHMNLAKNWRNVFPPSIIRFDTGLDTGADWRSNIHGEVTIALQYSKKSKAKQVIFSATPTMKPYETFLKPDYRRNPIKRTPHSSREGWSFNPAPEKFDIVDVYPPDNFRTFENRQAVKIDDDKNISHFYYLSNVDRNYVSLFRYEDKENGRGHKVISSPDADITHVSFNRSRSKPYWSITEAGFPKYEILSDEGRELFNLVDISSAHKTEILSMDSLGKRVVIKRISPQRGYEYLLVDTKERTSTLLESCPGANTMPWADVSELSFTASDGEPIWGYIYKPLKTEAPLPTIIYAHGGPSAHENLSVDNSYVKSLVGKGYVVVMVNYRGSTGYGRKFREGGWQNFALSRLDLIEAADTAITSNIADPNNVFVMGNSYGGFLALSMTLEKDTPFKAAISRNGISDLVDFLETPFTQSDGKIQKYDGKSYVFGDVNEPENRALLIANSTLHNIDSIYMPIFLAHAINDNRVPSSQSRGLHKAILNQSNDLYSQYVPLEGGHAISDMDVFNKYMDGVGEFLDGLLE